MTCKTKKCKHVRSIVGEAHIKCDHPSLLKHRARLLTEMLTMFRANKRSTFLDILMEELGVEAVQTGIENGWFNWPLNFAPVWLVNCDSFEENEQ